MRLNFTNHFCFLRKMRPKRTSKPILRLTYDKLGGNKEESDRDDDIWGSDVEDIDDLKDAAENPFDNPEKNEYESEGIDDSSDFEVEPFSESEEEIQSLTEEEDEDEDILTNLPDTDDEIEE